MAYAVGLARVTQPTYRNGRLALLLGTVEEKIPGRWIAGGGAEGRVKEARVRHSTGAMGVGHFHE